MKKQYVKICPNCRSRDIIFEATDFALMDVCNKCGFRMRSFPEIEVDVKEPKKGAKKKTGAKSAKRGKNG